MSMIRKDDSPLASSAVRSDRVTRMAFSLHHAS